MDYQNIVLLQESGLSLDEAKLLDLRGIRHDNFEYLAEYEEEKREAAERQADLEERGFYFGTDDQFLNEQFERGEAFQDRYDMYRNEY